MPVSYLGNRARNFGSEAIRIVLAAAAFQILGMSIARPSFTDFVARPQQNLRAIPHGRYDCAEVTASRTSFEFRLRSAGSGGASSRLTAFGILTTFKVATQSMAGLQADLALMASGTRRDLSQIYISISKSKIENRKSFGRRKFHEKEDRRAKWRPCCFIIKLSPEVQSAEMLDCVAVE